MDKKEIENIRESLWKEHFEGFVYRSEYNNAFEKIDKEFLERRIVDTYEYSSLDIFDLIIEKVIEKLQELPKDSYLTHQWGAIRVYHHAPESDDVYFSRLEERVRRYIMEDRERKHKIDSAEKEISRLRKEIEDLTFKGGVI